MSKRFSRGKNDSPAKKIKLDITREQSNLQKDQKLQQNVTSNNTPNDLEDLWGDDFGEHEIEEMDIIASQATQEEKVFVQPQPIVNPKKSPKYSTPLESFPSTSSGFRGCARYCPIVASQVISSNHCSDIDKEIIESTQAIIFDDFQTNIKVNMNSTLINGQAASQNNIVMVSDDDQVAKWKEEKKKLLEDFMTKEGETEFLRQQLNQIQARAENVKKEQACLLEEKERQMTAEKNALLKEKATLESSIQLLNLQVSSMTEKCKLLESGAIKFTQPQANYCKINRDRGNASLNMSTVKKAKTKETGIQVEEVSSNEHLKSTIILYPLKCLPQFAFEPSQPEKSVVDVKVEEKIGKRNLAIIQDEETFRISENPELSKPKVTVVDDKNLSTDFYLPDLAKLVNKSSDEINSFEAIPIINKMVATSLELLLNTTLVLQNISQVLQNDDIRDMNEFYMSEFYEMPVLHTKSTLEARSWYDFERGIEARRAIGTLAHVVMSCIYLGNFVAGKVKLNISKDVEYQRYIKQMKSYETWDKKGQDFEFLNLFLDFVTVVGVIRRAHQFTGLINAILALIINVQSTVGFCNLGLKRISFTLREIIFCRPLLACFIPISTSLKEFSHYDTFVKTFCNSSDKTGVVYWKGSPAFTLDGCALEIFTAQLETYKLDPVTMIHMTRDLTAFIHTALMTVSIPWFDTTINSCNCCLNILKLVMIYQCECSKFDVEELKTKYIQNDILWRISRCNINNKKQIISWKHQLREDWSSFENNRKENFWSILKILQFSTISHGIRLLSFLAKRDVDFTIRMTYIEDAFHVFLHNITKRNYFKLKTYDEAALDIVKKTFDLDKNREDMEPNQHKLDLINLESQRWTDISPPTSLDLLKLYNCS
ncbi:uncharacterized protein LOC131670639 [Phymastichus coffea]|uniref:uncharacterized protein LOC131670639 n=1 Tax=Phymastichus coffea TaxID=108790 RepID=UPI00273A90F3|nr:uncharacterized protein LOC131670639 [Phymastichus coffea]